MSQSVLFDEPGPRTRARHRLYTAMAAVALAALGAFVVWKFYEAGQFEAALWEPLVTPRYIQALLEGLLVTLQMAFSAVLGALVFGVLLGVGKLSEHAWVRWPCWAIVEFFRAVPLLILIIFIFFLWFIRSGDPGEYWSVVIALTLYNGAVLAEVFRAGILAVPPGQAEAAYAIGMRKTQVMTLVLLPQAVKIMLPAIISQCVIILKDTSLGFIILYPEVVRGAKQVANFVDDGTLLTFGTVAAVFILINYSLSKLAEYVERRLARRGERAVAVPVA